LTTLSLQDGFSGPDEENNQDGEGEAPGYEEEDEY
jgi:hypothetical protein